MAITVTEVTQVRKFKYSVDEPNGSSLYHVSFSTDTDAEYADYITKLNMCFTATQPGGSGDITDTIPTLYDQLENATISFPTYVRDIVPSIHYGQNNWWEVEVFYRQSDDDENGGGNEEEELLSDDPDSLLPTFSWGQGSEQRTIWLDRTPVADGGPLPICNSAGDPFTTLPKVDDSFVTLTVNRRTLAYDPLVAITVVNCVNDAALTLDGSIFATGQVKLKAWRANKKTAKVKKDGIPLTTTTFYDETRVYHIKDEGWLGEILDQGIQIFKNGYGKAAIRRFGQVTRSPKPLNGRGERIYDDEGVEIPGNAPVASIVGAGVPPGPGVDPLQAPGGKLAMLLFTYYPPADLSILGDN